MVGSGIISTFSRGISWGHPCGSLGMSLSPDFSLTPWDSPYQNISFIALPLCLSPSRQPHSLMFSSAIPYPLPNLPRRSLLFLLTRAIHGLLLGYSLLPSFPGAMDFGTGFLELIPYGVMTCWASMQGWEAWSCFTWMCPWDILPMGDLTLSEECMGSGRGRGSGRKNCGWYKNQF